MGAGQKDPQVATEPAQLMIDGGEKPHKDVVKELHPSRRRTVTMNDIMLVSSIIRDADLDDEDRKDLAVRFAEALSPMNTRFRFESFMAWCGVEVIEKPPAPGPGEVCNERHSDGRSSYTCLRSKGHAGPHSSSVRA